MKHLETIKHIGKYGIKQMQNLLYLIYIKRKQPNMIYFRNKSWKPQLLPLAKYLNTMKQKFKRKMKIQHIEVKETRQVDIEVIETF